MAALELLVPNVHAPGREQLRKPARREVQPVLVAVTGVEVHECCIAQRIAVAPYALDRIVRHEPLPHVQA